MIAGVPLVVESTSSAPPPPPSPAGELPWSKPGIRRQPRSPARSRPGARRYSARSTVSQQRTRRKPPSRAETIVDPARSTSTATATPARRVSEGVKATSIKGAVAWLLPRPLASGGRRDLIALPLHLLGVLAPAGGAREARPVSEGDLSRPRGSTAPRARSRATVRAGHARRRS